MRTARYRVGMAQAPAFASPGPRSRRRMMGIALAWLFAAVGVVLSVVSVRSFFVSDVAARWSLEPGATLMERPFPLPETTGMIVVEDGLRIFTLRTGRGRLQATWQRDRPGGLVSVSAPPSLFERWIWRKERPAAAPAMQIGRGWEGWAWGGIGARWTTAGSSELYETTQVSVPLPLLCAVLIAPLLALFVARLRRRKRRGFEVSANTCV